MRGGGGGVGRGRGGGIRLKGQCGCERRSKVFVKNQKKNLRGGVSRGRGVGGGSDQGLGCWGGGVGDIKV